MTRPSQNSQAGLRSCIRVVHPVDVAALVCSPNEARSFARPLTISSLGVRTTVHPGPSNSVGVMPTALYLRHPKRDPKHRPACKLTDAHQPSVSFLRHWSASVRVNTTHERAAPFLGTQHTQAGAVA